MANPSSKLFPPYFSRSQRWVDTDDQQIFGTSTPDPKPLINLDLSVEPLSWSFTAPQVFDPTISRHYEANKVSEIEWVDLNLEEMLCFKRRILTSLRELCDLIGITEGCLLIVDSLVRKIEMTDQRLVRLRYRGEAICVHKKGLQ